MVVKSRIVKVDLLQQIGEQIANEGTGFPHIIPGTRIERIPIDLIRPDPIQPRRVLPDSIHTAFHEGKLTPKQAIDAFMRRVQLVAKQNGRAFANPAELLQQSYSDDEDQATLTPEEDDIRDLVNLAITMRNDGQINPMTVVDLSRSASRSFRIETGERRYWAIVLLINHLVVRSDCF